MESTLSMKERTAPVSRASRWAGWIIGAFAVLFLLLDGALKALQLAPAVEATTQLGYPSSLTLGIGILELVCLIIYITPRASILGAILLTGYLGGAIATHVRIGSEPFPMIFPVVIGVLLWGSLFLRDPRLRTLLPLRA